MRVGVLALQGGFGAHLRTLKVAGHSTVEVRRPDDLEEVEGLVLPGGESSTQLRLLKRNGLEGALDAFVLGGRPVLATCAGLILAARAVTKPSQWSFGWLDVAVARNAYGRQLDSFETSADANAGLGCVPLVFIRAPRIVEVGRGVNTFATLRGEPILVKQGAVVGATFHPELTADLSVFRLAFG